MSDEEMRAKIDAVMRTMIEKFEKVVRPLLDSVVHMVEACEGEPIRQRPGAAVLLRDLQRDVIEKLDALDIPALSTALAEHLEKFRALMGGN